MEGNHLTNKLAHFRKRMKFSQKQVAAILGLTNVGTLSNYERGSACPSLERAFSLAIVYRVPVEFLFPDLHDWLKAELRQRENLVFHLPEDPDLFGQNQVM
jgi:transcriptional regulator with XRE-family HTH domain